MERDETEQGGGDAITTINYITVHTRDLGYGSEEYEGEAYITDEVDTWGKRTVLIPTSDFAENGFFVKWYLFADEYEVTP